MSHEQAPAAGLDITVWRVLAIAVPVVISNVTVPLQGAVDTAIIGRLGEVTALAAVGLGAEIFSLLFGAFNFLQIGVSGLSAQALGARDPERVAYTLLRGLAIGAAIGATLFILQAPIIWMMLGIFEASAEAEGLAGAYFGWRMLGAPAELMNYALVGWFAGQEQVRKLFIHQVVLATLNIAFNIVLVTQFELGVVGVAIGTAAASWLGLGVGLALAYDHGRRILPPGWRPARAGLAKADELWRMLLLNRDIFIRTILLVGAFVWMVRLGSVMGDEILAANIVLWQFFILSAYGMDGFAIAAETLVGQTIGARDQRRLDQTVRLIMRCAGVLAAAVALTFTLLSGSVIDLFTTSEIVRATARDYALWATLIPLIGVWSFMYDGIFIGATGSREMRNGMIVASGVYFPLSYPLMSTMGNHGVWLAVWIWLALRAATLAYAYPAVRARAARE